MEVPAEQPPRWGCDEYIRRLKTSLCSTKAVVKAALTMARLKRSNQQQGDELAISLIGLAAVFVACAIWWSLAPQWLTSSWQLF